MNSYEVLFNVVVQAYEMRNAGAVIHSHGMESCLVTMLNPQAKEFRVSPNVRQFQVPEFS